MIIIKLIISKMTKHIIGTLLLLVMACTPKERSGNIEGILANLQEKYPESADYEITEERGEVLVDFVFNEDNYQAMYKKGTWNYTHHYTTVYDLPFEITDKLASDYPFAAVLETIEYISENENLYILELEDDGAIYTLIMDPGGSVVKKQNN